MLRNGAVAIQDRSGGIAVKWTAAHGRGAVFKMTADFAPIWLDAAHSVGTVGFLCNPNFRPWTEQVDLNFVAQGWRSGSDRRLQVLMHDSFTVHFSDSRGFTFKIDPHNLSVSFAYPVQVDGISAEGEAVASLGAQVYPFSGLFPQLLREAIWLLHSLRTERQLIRIGCVATTSFASESLPPGVEEFARSAGALWGKKPRALSSRVLIELSRTEEYVEQCHHQIEYKEERESATALTLDWQRVITAPLQVGGSSWRADLSKRADQLVESCGSAAYGYFERFAEASF